MENNKPSAVKTVLLIIGIMLTIVLYPLFLFLPLGGGVATGAFNFLKDENVENMVVSSNISGIILDESWKEAKDKYLSDAGVEIKTDALQDIYERVITSKDIDKIILDTWKAMKNGKKVDYDLSAFEDRLNTEIDKVFEEVPEDLFRAWKGEYSSQYFTDSYLKKMASKISDAFEGLSYEEVKARYEMTGATEPFDAYLEREWQQKKQEIDITSYTNISETLDEIKQNLEENVNETITKPDVRDAFMKLEDAEKLSGKLIIVIYGVILIAALILLVLYLFRPAGFYVTGTGMILGGAVCGMVSFFHGTFMRAIEKILEESLSSAGSIGNSAEDVLINIIEASMKNLEKDIWKFGRISFILGVIMIGIGIFLHVMAQNKKVAE